jgi:hypothetical protein
MILEVRILNELRGYFVEVRILKDLHQFEGGRRPFAGLVERFEQLIWLTQQRVS